MAGNFPTLLTKLCSYGQAFKLCRLITAPWFDGPAARGNRTIIAARLHWLFLPSQQHSTPIHHFSFKIGSLLLCFEMILEVWLFSTRSGVEIWILLLITNDRTRLKNVIEHLCWKQLCFVAIFEKWMFLTENLILKAQRKRYQKVTWYGSCFWLCSEIQGILSIFSGMEGETDGFLWAWVHLPNLPAPLQLG